MHNINKACEICVDLGVLIQQVSMASCLIKELRLAIHRRFRIRQTCRQHHGPEKQLRLGV